MNFWLCRQCAQDKVADISTSDGTVDETAYPMGFARLIAVVFTRVLLRCGIALLADTLEQVQPCSLQALLMWWRQ